jgi:hypothetical protein
MPQPTVAVRTSRLAAFGWSVGQVRAWAAGLSELEDSPGEEDTGLDFVGYPQQVRCDQGRVPGSAWSGGCPHLPSACGSFLRPPRYPGAIGYRVVAFELTGLSSLFRKEWATIEERSGLKRSDLDEA